MMFAHHAPQRARPRLGAACVLVLVAALSTGLLASLGVARAATTVPLGTAEDFAVLAGSTITNTGPSTVTGDVGFHPGSSVTGFGDVTQDGSLHVADDLALQSKSYWVLISALVLFVAGAFSYRGSRR